MAADDKIIAFTSGRPFGRTLERITVAIEAAGLTIFARIDHAAAAEAVGLHMPPTTVIIYGNARGGTPVMLAAPNAALDLPLRVLVREDAGGDVVVAFHPVGGMLEKAGVPPDMAARLAPAQQLLIGAMREGARE